MTRIDERWIELAPEDPDPVLAAGGPVGLVPRVERQHHAPDLTLLLLQSGALVARASCWWSNTPVLDRMPAGVIGHYAAADAGCARRLLDRACGALRAAGIGIAIGPMDGSTWRRYRFVTECGTEPTFLLEPDNPDDWPAQWRRAGFEEIAHYSSALVDPIPADDARAVERERRVAEAGITIRTIDLSRADVELDRLFALSLDAFTDNYLYTPISRAEFIAQYRAVLPHVRPELVFMAERDTDLVGFMFSLPNLLEARGGRPVVTAILKTLAVAPRARGIGLGTVLLARAHAGARALGMHRAIHALIHEHNVSRQMSDHYGRAIRRYALFARRLTL